MDPVPCFDMDSYRPPVKIMERQGNPAVLLGIPCAFCERNLAFLLHPFVIQI